mgnify:FL=1
MRKINEILMVVILLLTAVLAGAVGLKAYQNYDARRQLAIQMEEKALAEMMARNEEAQERVKQMSQEIEHLAKDDKEELTRFVEEIQTRQTSVSENISISGNISVSENQSVSEDLSVSGNSMVSGNESVSGNGTISGNSLVSGNVSVSGNQMVSGNDGEINYYDGTRTNDSIFDEWRTIYVQPQMTLEERRQYRTSLEETLEVNQADREYIAENTIDFSQMKIACLGDSITAAANLEGEEGYEQYAYPTRLQELLGAKEVVNLGIGGSSIGRYWADAFVDRYQDIPEDTDIIIIMGGTNDGFCVSEAEFGNLEERAYRTFCGDLNELFAGVKKNYPNAQVFVATPLPNILQDYLMSERDYLQPQKRFAEVIITLTSEYNFHVVDLYNSNILDSHDANIIADYMPDGVHCNKEGYQILAEHFAAELIRNSSGNEEE